jgi:hypothetical protein
MATTTNFGWETPDDTDLVKDGAAAIRTALGGVDTSFVDLKGGTTGQVLAKASNTDLDYTWTAPSSFGTWTSFTPTWTNLTVGNGTVTAKYVQNGKIVTFRVKLIWGSTTSITGDVGINWPIAAASTEAAQGATTTVIFEKSGAGPKLGLASNAGASTTKINLYAITVGGTYTDIAVLSNTVPFTWGSPDQIYFQGSYEVA